MLSNTVVPRYYGEFRDKVMRGEIRVCKEISMQMNRIDQDIANPNFYFDGDAVEDWIYFCESELVLPTGVEFKLLPSFKLWAEDLMGWYEFVEEKVFDPRTQRLVSVQKKKRLRTRQYLIIARGNAKSVYLSCHHAWGLVRDTDTTHQITAAPTMAQGEEVVTMLRTSIAKSRGPIFKFLTKGNKMGRTESSFKKLDSTKKGVENRLTNSLLEVRPLSINKLQGLRNKYSTLDEWLSGELREDPLEAIEQGADKGGLDEYVIVAASSEGTVRDGVGDTIKMELLSILSGEVYNPHYSIWYYRLDDLSEVNDPTAWEKASPNIGTTVNFSTYHEAVRKLTDEPSKRNDILAKRFGIPVEGQTYFFKYEETEPHPYTNFDGFECSMGMDASQGDDFWAFTFMFPLGAERYGVDTRSYVSRHKYDRLPEATRLRYNDFVAEGSLVIMDEPVLDWRLVYDDIDNYIEQHGYGVASFGYDPYNAGPFVDRWTSERGNYGITPVRQGARTESVPLGQLKILARERRLIFWQQLMKFSMGNSIALVDNNDNYKLSKKRSDQKIDNVAAMLDAWVAYDRFKEDY